MRLIGGPVIFDGNTILQFAETRDGRVVPFRVAVCKDQPGCCVMFFETPDCGPHFRWATPDDIDRMAERGAVA